MPDLSTYTQEFWDTVAGPKWVADQENLDAMLAPFADAVLLAANPQPGQRVVDVGCGCGALSLEVARRGAEAIGVDVSGPMLAHARSRAQALGLAVDFNHADAQTHGLSGVHRVISRFGVMFFPEPATAFRNIRSWLAPDGELHVMVWRSMRENAWLSEPAALAKRFVELPKPGDPKAPGPFSLADREHLTALLAGAGFEQVTLTPVDLNMRLNTTPERAAQFFQERGPVAKALEMMADSPEPLLRAIREYVGQRHDGQGLDQSAACWQVRAS